MRVEQPQDTGALEVVQDHKPDLRWLSDVMTVRVRRPQWLIRNVWSRGGCGFIAGEPKSFKSWFGMDFLISAATGHPFLGDPQFAVIGGPQPMLYLQEEDGEVIVRDRLENVVSGKV